MRRPIGFWGVLSRASSGIAASGFAVFSAIGAVDESTGLAEDALRHVSGLLEEKSRGAAEPSDAKRVEAWAAHGAISYASSGAGSALRLAKTWDELVGRTTVLPGGAETRQGHTRGGALHHSFPHGKTRGPGVSVYRQRAPSTVVVVASNGHGSGIVVDSPSFILTNWHVVGSEPVAQIVYMPADPGVSDLGGLERVSADVVALDPSVDLALLRVAVPDDSRKATPLGVLEKLEVGSDVYAIGHPFGHVWSFTEGSVSQIRHGYTWTYQDGTQHSATVIQTQTPINPGSSGGPLFNQDGDLVGLNSFMDSRAGFLNFAVAVDTIRAFLNEKPMKRPGSPRRGLPGGVKLLQEFDRDDDGSVETWLFDATGDGQGDFWLWDRDGDGEPDVFLFDFTKNGMPDTVARDTTGDGLPDLYEIDENEDGKVDTWGQDLNADGRIDKVWKQSAPG